MIKKMLATTALCVAIAATLPVFGQQQQNTLGNLWPQVEENYPGVGARLSAVDAAQLNERAVKSDMLPQVKAQAQNTYGTFNGSAGGFFPQPGFFNVSGAGNEFNASSTTANSFGSATVEWEFFSFGRLQKEKKAAGALSEKAISEKDVYILELKKVLSERYIHLLYNDAKLKWTQRNTQRLDTIRDITSGLSGAGLRPAADSLLASSSYVQALGEQDKWEGLKEAALYKLVELYGERDLDYAASTQRFPQPALFYSGGKALGSNHPVLEALEQHSQYYEFSGEAQKRSSLPSLRLLGGYSVRGSGINPEGSVSEDWQDGFGNTSTNVLAGIGLTWDITGLHRNRLRGEELLKEAEGTGFLRAQYEQAMHADFSASRAKITQQFEQLEKTRLAVKQSQQAYGMYLSRYQSGLISLSELLQIRILLEQAENQHIEASREYWLLLAYEAELTADFSFLFNNL